MLKGKLEEVDEEAMAKYFEFICDDIKRERERIGGDWAVALVVNTRRLRDLVRSRLGPDLTFVVLDMAWEDMEERYRTRHVGNETALRMMMVSLTLIEANLLKFLVKLNFLFPANP